MKANGGTTLPSRSEALCCESRIRGERGGPPFGQAEETALGHLHKSQGLPAGDEKRSVPGSSDLKMAPEAGTGCLTERTVNFQFVTKERRAFIVDLRADNNRVDGGFFHLLPVHAELHGHECPGRLDKAEIGNVVHDAPGIGVKEHDLNRGDNGGRIQEAQAVLGLGTGKARLDPFSACNWYHSLV